MSGYLNDYSMSVNAYNAYQENKKPLSKWNKTEILDLIYDNKKELYFTV